MTWTYHQSTGELWRDGKLIAKGYSGAPGHINATASEGIRNHGPIPRGRWRMFYVYQRHARLGPTAIALKPEGHKALGRSDFMVHADSVRRPGAASQGCIILPNSVRVAMAACVGKGGDGELVEVV
jgi:hypothetical protein